MLVLDNRGKFQAPFVFEDKRVWNLINPDGQLGIFVHNYFITWPVSL